MPCEAVLYKKPVWAFDAFDLKYAVQVEGYHCTVVKLCKAVVNTCNGDANLCTATINNLNNLFKSCFVVIKYRYSYRNTITNIINLCNCLAGGKRIGFVLRERLDMLV